MRIICRTILAVALAAANCALGANAFPEARGVLVRFAGEAVAEEFAFDRMYAAEPQAEVLAKDGKILVRATDENRAAAAVGRYIRFGGVASWFPDTLFIESLGIFILCWLTCWFLHRHKKYLKI